MKKTRGALPFLITTFIGIVLFSVLSSIAARERGYDALGGEVLTLILPHLIWYVMIPTFKDTLREIFCLSKYSDSYDE